MPVAALLAAFVLLGLTVNEFDRGTKRSMLLTIVAVVGLLYLSLARGSVLR